MQIELERQRGLPKDLTFGDKVDVKVEHNWVTA